MAFLFPSLSEMPGYEVTQPSPETQGLIEEQKRMADLTPEAIQAQRMAALPKAPQVQETALYNKALGMANPDQINSALQMRANRAYGQQLANMRRAQMPDAYRTLSGYQKNAFNSVARQGQIMLEQAAGQRDAALAKEAARNATISSILSGVGTVGGAAIGTFIAPGAGTLAGAAIGGKLGSSL